MNHWFWLTIAVALLVAGTISLMRSQIDVRSSVPPLIPSGEVSDEERRVTAEFRQRQQELVDEELRAYRTITELCGDVRRAWWASHTAAFGPSNKQVVECLEKWKAQAERPR